MKAVIIMVASMIWLSLAVISVLSNLTVFAKGGSGDQTDTKPLFVPTATKPGACLEKTVDPEWRPYGGGLPGYVYTTRVKNPDGTWGCPADLGYFDTGCTNAHGRDVEKLQCRKIARNSPGLWKSPEYGGGGGGGMKTHMCGPGEIVSHVVGFYGQNNNSNTNAFTAFCKKPGEEKVMPIMNEVTCGKRNYPDASQGIADFLQSLFAVINIDFLNVYQKSFGRSVYKDEFASSERGFDSWEVKVKDNEVQGLRLRSRDQTQMVAGGKDPNARYAVHTGECPPGKVLVGFRASCGDRVDRIQMLCDAENHTHSRTLST